MSVLLNSGQNKSKKPQPTSASVSASDPVIQCESFSSYTPSDTIKVWNCIVDGHNISIALDKETEEIWCNDSLLKTKNESHKNVTCKQFGLYNHVARLEIAKKPESSLSWCVKPKSSGNKAVIATLRIDNKIVPIVANSDLMN